MPTGYMLNWSDNTLKPPFLLPEATVDNHTTSLQLTGKRVVNWGEFLNENMLHLLEHGFSKTAPNNPTIGQLWLDANTGDLKIYTSQLTWNVIKTVPGIGTQTTTSTTSTSTSTSTSIRPGVTINWSGFGFMWDFIGSNHPAATDNWSGEPWMNSSTQMYFSGLTASDNTTVKIDLSKTVGFNFSKTTDVRQRIGITVITPATYSEIIITAYTDSGASETRTLSSLLPSGAYPWQPGYKTTWVNYPWPYRFNY